MPGSKNSKNSRRSSRSGISKDRFGFYRSLPSRKRGGDGRGDRVVLPFRQHALFRRCRSASRYRAPHNRIAGRQGGRRWAQHGCRSRIC